MNLKTRLIILLTTVIMGLQANESSDENALLKKQIKALTERLDKLENHSKERKQKKRKK
jgi:Tfp pilus assembly protein PilN